MENAERRCAGAVWGRVGFRMEEIMSGTHRFVDGAGPEGEHPLEFRIHWGPDALGPYLNPFGREFLLNALEGTITVGGLVEEVPCHGTLELRYLQDATVRYTIDFEGPDGKAYRYLGEKRNIRPWNLHRSHTICYGSVKQLDTGREIATSVVTFDLRRLPAFLASFRFARSADGVSTERRAQ